MKSIEFMISDFKDTKLCFNKTNMLEELNKLVDYYMEQDFADTITVFVRADPKITNRQEEIIDG